MLASLHSVSQNQIDQFVLSQAPAAVESDALPFTDAQEEVNLLENIVWKSAAKPVRKLCSLSHKRKAFGSLFFAVDVSLHWIQRVSEVLQLTINGRLWIW